MSERETRALIAAMLSAYSEWPLNRRDMEVEVSKWLGWLRDRNALTPTSEGAYEHPEHGLTCHVGGCKLELVDEDEGTCYYRPVREGGERCPKCEGPAPLPNDLCLEDGCPMPNSRARSEGGEREAWAVAYEVVEPFVERVERPQVRARLRAALTGGDV